jgi:hypothetical protein
MSSSKCPNAVGCGLFPVLAGSGLLRVWQINYCESSFDRCVRYQRMVSGAAVPPTMLPNGEILAALAKKMKS